MDNKIIRKQDIIKYNGEVEYEIDDAYLRESLNLLYQKYQDSIKRKRKNIPTFGINVCNIKDIPSDESDCKSIYYIMRDVDWYDYKITKNGITFSRRFNDIPFSETKQYFFIDSKDMCKYAIDVHINGKPERIYLKDYVKEYKTSKIEQITDHCMFGILTTKRKYSDCEHRPCLFRILSTSVKIIPKSGYETTFKQKDIVEMDTFEFEILYDCDDMKRGKDVNYGFDPVTLSLHKPFENEEKSLVVSDIIDELNSTYDKHQAYYYYDKITLQELSILHKNGFINNREDVTNDCPIIQKYIRERNEYLTNNLSEKIYGQISGREQTYGDAYGIVARPSGLINKSIVLYIWIRLMKDFGYTINDFYNCGMPISDCENNMLASIGLLNICICDDEDIPMDTHDDIYVNYFHIKYGLVKDYKDKMTKCGNKFKNDVDKLIWYGDTYLHPVFSSFNEVTNDVIRNYINNTQKQLIDKIFST